MNPYIPLLMLFGFVGLLGVIILALSHLVSPKKDSAAKMQTYECGFDPIGDSRHRFSVKFYLVAMLFILFDVEVVFLYPWAVLFKESAQTGLGPFLMIEMGIFLGILVIGLAYVYARKALDWK
ncbi:MAG TPA: NADH-quinone oxidoreductase subunit A [bacterium]|nr:NADH-quinone oxidoreductase subunit A [bacterium]